MRQKTNRRDFLKYTAAGSVGFWVAGRAAAADELASRSPSERINVASIGIGGKGDSDSDQAANHANLIGICDIDDKRLDSKSKRYPKAGKFNDFRVMLDKLGKEIDAVTISTPDFTHAAATMMAIRMGKHVYTQKPLTHDVFEARQLRLAAREHKIMSQMGNQGTATNGLRKGVEVIQAGIIGPVKEVHVWTDRPYKWWPQSPDIRELPPEAPVPDYVHWDLWLGTAPARPYAAKYYHPHNWRGWWDFGCGALGDMGCHTVNLPFMALKLGHPSSIVAESEELNSQTFPGWAHVTFQFPARGSTGLIAGGEMPAVKLNWYEGHKDGKLVRPPGELVEKVEAEYNKVLVRRNDKRVKDGKTVSLAIGGSIMVGEKGILYSPGDYGNDWELLPAEEFADYKAPSPTLERNPYERLGVGNDEGNKVEWLASIKGGPKPMSNFDYSGMLAETILLGNVAIRAGGTPLQWDGPNMKFPNAPQAEKFLKRNYREPWTL